MIMRTKFSEMKDTTIDLRGKTRINGVEVHLIKKITIATYGVGQSYSFKCISLMDGNDEERACINIRKGDVLVIDFDPDLYNDITVEDEDDE